MVNHYSGAGGMDRPGVDLFAYAAGVLRRWRVVLAVAVVCVAAAAISTVVASAIAPRYEAETALLLTGSKYRLTLDPKFTTTDTAASQLAGKVDELRAIAASREVSEIVTKALDPNDLAAKERSTLEVRVRGALLTLTVVADSPDAAAHLANAYAAAVSTRLDSVYGLAEQDQGALDGKLGDAIRNHQAAESRLADFLRQNQIDDITRQISEREAARQAIFAQSTGWVRSRIAASYTNVEDLDRLKRDAETLRQDIRGGQSAAGFAANALALMRLQSRLSTLASSNSLQPADLDKDGRPVVRTNASRLSEDQLQINVDTLASASPQARQQLTADADALVTSTDRRLGEARADLRNMLQDFSRTGSSAATAQLRVGDAATEAAGQQLLQRLTAEIQALQGRLREETFKKEVLQQDVDLAKTARTALESKVQESRISAATAGGRPVIASSAFPPTRPSYPPPLSRSIPVAVVVGLLLGVIYVLVTDALTARRPRRPFVEPSPPTAVRASVLAE